MRPEQPRGEDRPIPTFAVGQRVEAKIDSVEETTGNYGKQLQLNMTIGDGYPVKAWVKYYAVPQPNQHLGKLCLAIERVNKQNYNSINDAITALKNYGRIFLEAKQPKAVTGTDGVTRTYPRFSVWPELLPGEQAMPPQTGLPSALPTQIATETPLSEKVYDWLVANQDIIGKQIPSEVYNKFIGQGIIEELHRLGHVKMVQNYPWLVEGARTLLMK